MVTMSQNHTKSIFFSISFSLMLLQNLKLRLVVWQSVYRVKDKKKKDGKTKKLEEKLHMILFIFPTLQLTISEVRTHLPYILGRTKLNSSYLMEIEQES